MALHFEGIEDKEKTNMVSNIVKEEKTSTDTKVEIESPIEEAKENPEIVIDKGHAHLLISSPKDICGVLVPTVEDNLDMVEYPARISCLPGAEIRTADTNCGLIAICHEP